MLKKLSNFKKDAYLDYAATTPLDPRVKQAMALYESKNFGNPSSLHSMGREAKTAVATARSRVAKIINAKPEEIIFTAGGTESVNLAIFGVAKNFKISGQKKYHLISSAVEHHCVLHSFGALAGEGYQTTLIGVDAFGRVNLEQLKSSLRPETIFISVMLANNEIGTIQPIAEIGKWLRVVNADRLKNGLSQIIFHTDACQAAGSLNLNVQQLGVDLMTLNGSKIYGPKQTGFLYVKSGISLSPLIYGGGQEKGLRAGTENVPGVVGLAKALELAQAGSAKENARLLKLQAFFTKQIVKTIPNIILNGADNSKLKVSEIKNKEFSKLPNNINITFLGAEGEALMLYLDSYGFCVSTASACSTAQASHVLLAIGRTLIEAKSTVRFTLGRSTTLTDIKKLLKILPQLVGQLRKLNNNI